MTAMESILQEHPFFSDIESHYLNMIAEHSSYVTFERGRLVFRQGEPANTFYIISQGHVALEVFAPDQGPISLMTLGEGEVLGWSWLFDPYTWHLDARAIEETQAIALDGTELRAQCEANHELGYLLMRRSVVIVQQRLQAAMMQLIDMYGLKN